MTNDQSNPVLITGATGFVGSALMRSLLADGRSIVALSRRPEKVRKAFPQVEALGSLEDLDSQRSLSAVVNLAGAPILDRRWSERRKQVLYDSRIETTKALVELFQRLHTPPSVLISGSAIGFYGSQDDAVVLETHKGRPCFAHKLCHDWEQVASQAERLGIRVCLLRTGVVLGPKGGALARMLPAFRLGLGGPIGDGRQWMSWIQLDDMVAAIRFLLEKEVLAGPFNLTAPEPVTNREFSQALGRVLHRPARLPMPALVLRLLLGEGASLLVEGQRVLPGRLQEAGFEFRYRQLEEALRASVK